MAYCKIRKDLIEEGIAVSIGDESVFSDEHFRYRWVAGDEFEIFHKGRWLSSDSIDYDFFEDLKDRIAKLPDVYCFTQNLCALIEMKETDHNSNTDMDIKLSMYDSWNAITECAIGFTEKHVDTEWDGEWYEALEVFYGEEVRKLLFEI